ncbi:MAG: hypothetical protein AAGB23_05435 [Pseudomonadota bacterium]
MNREALIEAMARALKAGVVTPQHGDRIDAQAALQAITDAGYAVVPVEPTEAMTRQGMALALKTTLSGDYTWRDYAQDFYKAMIEASQ